MNKTWFWHKETDDKNLHRKEVVTKKHKDRTKASRKITELTLQLRNESRLKQRYKKRIQRFLHDKICPESNDAYIKQCLRERKDKKVAFNSIGSDHITQVTREQKVTNEGKVFF